jgi:8-oxo-dGTP pyrophosphatase MutT (NUDIX family)
MRVDDVRRLVGTLSPSDDREADFLRRVTALVEELHDPWRRDRYAPGHLTASAFVLHPTEPSIALVHHAKLAMWVQPGGHVELDDPDHQFAARREVEEECGLTELVALGLLDLDIHVFPERKGNPRHLHFDLRWAFRARDCELVVGDGTTDVRWVALTDAAGMHESVARPARKLLDSIGRPGRVFAE